MSLSAAVIRDLAQCCKEASFLLHKGSSAYPDWHLKANNLVRRMDALTGYEHDPQRYPEKP